MEREKNETIDETVRQAKRKGSQTRTKTIIAFRSFVEPFCYFFLFSSMPFRSGMFRSVAGFSSYASVQLILALITTFQT